MTNTTTVDPVTTSDFQAQVLERSAAQPVLVDFWAPWCGPCRALAPVLEKIADELAGKLRVVKLDTDEEPEIAQRYAIRSIPAVKLFRGGRVVAEFVGAQPYGAVRAFLEPHLPRPSAAEHAAALELAERGNVAGAVAALTQVHASDPANLEATLDLTHWLAVSGAHDEAAGVLDALSPAAQSDSAVRATRAFVHFSRLAAGAKESPRTNAASAFIEARAQAGLDALFDWWQSDRKGAGAAAREDLLHAFDLLGESHALVPPARRRLAALLH
jgi:putative thioredoxin